MLIFYFFIVTHGRVCILILKLSFLSSRQRERKIEIRFRIRALGVCSRRGIPDNGRSSGVDGGQRPFSDDID